MPEFARGGVIPGPGREVEITHLRTVDEDGLHVISIDGGRPEYVMSNKWIREHPGQLPLGDPPEAAGWVPPKS